MSWGLFGKAVGGLVLLCFGLYGAFLAGGTRRPPEVTHAVGNEIQDSGNHVGFSTDGRFGTSCGGAPCRIPFVRLVASPKTYQGQRVMVAGLLAVGPSGVALYPTRDSAKFEIGDALWLEEKRGVMNGWPRFIPEAMWPRLEQGIWVTVVGTFDANYPTQLLTVGVLRDPERVEDIPEYRFQPAPIVPPPPKLKHVSPQSEEPPQFEIQRDRS